MTELDQTVQCWIIAFWLILLLPQAVRGDEFSCTYCHSERLVQTNRDCPKWQKRSHPVNIFPSRMVEVPDDIPLDEGKLTCNSCHIIIPGKDENILTLRTIEGGTSFCKRCHVRKLAKDNTIKEKDISPNFDRLVDDDYVPESSTGFDVGFKKSFSHPVNVDSRRVPRRIIEKGGKTGKSKHEIICETCHTMHNAEGDNLLVIGNDRSELCGTCHSRMFGIDRLKSSLKGTHPINTVPHGVSLLEFLATTKGKVGTDDTIGCLTCHSVHYAAQEKGLLVDNNVKGSFCLKCHDRQFKNIEGTGHDFTGRKEAVNIEGENAEQAGICSSCHLVHGGTGPKIWARPLVFRGGSKDIIRELCLGCHKEDALAGDSVIGKYSHPTAVNISKIDKAYVSLPLYSGASGIPIGQGDVTCASCHNVHRWDPETDSKGRNKRGNNTNSFLRYRNIKSSLCFRCHKKQKTIAGTTHDPTQEIYKGATVPLRVLSGRVLEAVDAQDEGICGRCHSSHNAVSVKLWNRQVGEGGDEISKICLSCHDDEVVASRKQTGDFSHPVNVSLEKLPSSVKTILPLFKDDSGRSPSGKILCNTCHDIHQWAPEKEQRGSIKKGGYLRLSVNDPETPLCQECHREEGMVQGTDHDLNVSAPREKNSLGETVGQSGLCGSCHAVHNACASRFLWSKKPGVQADYISEACFTCHAKGGCASGKAVGLSSHPVNVSTFSVLDDITSTVLPIYDTNYRRVKLPSLTPIPPDFIDSVYESRKFDAGLYKRDRKLLKKFRLYKQNYLNVKNIQEELRTVALGGIKAKQKIKMNILKLEPRLKEVSKKLEKQNERLARHKQKGGELLARQQEALKNQGEIKDLVEKEEKRSLKKLNKDTKAGPRRFVLSKQKKKEELSKKEILKLVIRTEKLEKLLNALEAVNQEVSGIDRELKDYNGVLETLKEELEEMTGSKKELITEIKKQETIYEKYTLRLNKVKKRYDHLQERKEELRDNILDINPLAFNEERQKPMEEFETSFSEIIPLDYEQKYKLLLKDEEILEKRIARDKKKYDLLRIKFQEILVNPDLIKEITALELAESVEDGLVEYIENREEPPQGIILCTSCHNVHIWDGSHPRKGDGKAREGDQLTSFLRIPNREGMELCVNCHVDQKYIEKTAHDLRFSAPGSRNRLGETPGQSGVCGSCHRVHNAPGQVMLWARQAKKGNIDALLVKQTEGRKMLAGLKKAKRSYFKLKRKKRGLRKPYLALQSLCLKQRMKVDRFRKFVDKVKERNKNKRSGFIINKLNNYQKKLDGMLAIFNRNSRKLKKVKKLIDDTDEQIKEKNKYMKDNLPHFQRIKAEYNALLAQQKKSHLDAMSRLCESCHSEKGLAGRKTVGHKSHPINIKAKAVSDKTEESRIEEEFPYPLYDYAGNKRYETGRIFCPTCHDPHRWEPDKDKPGLGAGRARGNGSNSFLRDISTSSSTLCIKCHPEQAEVAGTKHDLSLSAPESVNIRGEKVSESGVCGSCHITHNAPLKHRIWGRKLGEPALASWDKKLVNEKDINNRLCTACHSPQGIAGRSLPGKALHRSQGHFYLKEPKKYLEKPAFPYYLYKIGTYLKKLAVSELYDRKVEPRFQVYTEEGSKSVTGKIVCLTCHDPHRWSLGKEARLVNRSTMGSSFLRPGVAGGFCADCHGTRTLRSYAFFHGEKKAAENPAAHWKEEMDNDCLSRCHRKNLVDCFHMSGIKLKEEQQDYIPQNFPLTKEGEMTCVTCHDPGLQTAQYAANREMNPMFLRGIFNKPIKRKRRKKPVSAKSTQSAQPEKQKTLRINSVQGRRLTKFQRYQLKLREQKREKVRKARQRAVRQKLADMRKKQRELAEEKRNKYCLFCHDENQFKIFSVHQRQLDKGKKVKEVCRLCHSRNPDRKAENLYLILKPEEICVDCHPAYRKKHPGGQDHFMVSLTRKEKKQIGFSRGVSKNLYLPFADQKMACYTCHDPHPEGVITSTDTRVREINRNFLRLRANNRCTFCHEHSAIR
ncbi:MAG: cytochrome c3 family protein [bacterium]